MLVCLAAAGGCSSPARVVTFNRETGTGVVAVPAGTHSFPFYYHREALAMIEKQVGPHYKILDEREIAPDPRNPNQPGQQQTVSGSVTQQNTTEYRITFQRLSAPIVNSNINSGVTTGLTPTGGPVPVGGIAPAGGMMPMQGGAAPGVVPSVFPGR